MLKEERYDAGDYWEPAKAEDREGAYQAFLDDGKVAINELLWKFLPEETTLGEADRMATEIYCKISECWEQLWVNQK